MAHKWGLFGALALGVALSAGSAFAHQDTGHADSEVGMPEAASGEEAEADGHEHHVPTLDDFNWYYGVLGEREGVEPSVLYRPKGMPVPFAAMLLNSCILYFLLYRFSKKPIAEGLKNRKATILKGIDEASRMKKDAEARLGEYEEKLANIDAEIERVRREMREAGEHERTRVLADAKEKRTRLEREAHALVEQELKAVRELLFRETVRGALKSAEATLTSQMNASDQQRLADEYLAGIKDAAAALKGKL